MLDKLNITYEEFPEDDLVVMTVGRGDEAIEMFTGDLAILLHNVLIGEDCIVMPEGYDEPGQSH